MGNAPMGREQHQHKRDVRGRPVIPSHPSSDNMSEAPTTPTFDAWPEDLVVEQNFPPLPFEEELEDMQASFSQQTQDNNWLRTTIENLDEVVWLQTQRVIPPPANDAVDLTMDDECYLVYERRRPFFNLVE